MTAFAIMQEPGAQALARRERCGLWGAPEMKRVGSVEIFDEGEKFALGEFVHERYLAKRNRQFKGFRFEWRGARGRKWRSDDGADPGTRGRSWSVVVTLQNGNEFVGRDGTVYVNRHETRFEAWEIR